MLLDYYAILGVEKTATAEQIKKTYRQQAKELHPDVSSDILATAKFQLLNEAYHILINIRKKRIYDYKLKNQIEYTRSGTYRHPDIKYKYHRRYTRKYYQNSTIKENAVFFKKKFMDNFLFYSLLTIGLVGIIFGIFDIFYKEWMGLSNLNGIFFSICFTGILIYGWRLLGKNS